MKEIDKVLSSNLCNLKVKLLAWNVCHNSTVTYIEFITCFSDLAWLNSFLYMFGQWIGIFLPAGSETTKFLHVGFYCALHN